MITAISDNVKISETEFLRRELGINLKKVNPKTLKPKNSTIIVSHNSEVWRSFLKKAKPNSIIFILLGNESYMGNLYMALNNLPSIKIALIYNSPRNNSLIGVKTCFGFVVDSPKSIFEPKFYRTWKNAFDFSRKTRKFSKKMNFKFRLFPQGYTNRFVFELKKAGLLPKEYKKSLIDFPFPSYDFSKPLCLGFVGRESNWTRIKILNIYRNKPFFYKQVTNAWGGLEQGTKTDYVNTILQSKGFMNPPGNISNETHKYWEVLILNRLPICTANSFQDHHFTGYWSEKYLKGLKKWSNRKLSSYIIKLNSSKYEDYIQKAKNDLKRDTKLISELLKKFSN